MNGFDAAKKKVTRLCVNWCVCVGGALHITEQWTPHLLITSSASKMQTTPPTSLTASHSSKETNASSVRSFFSPLFSSLFSLFPLVSCPGYFFLSLFPRNLLSCLLSSPLQRVVLPLAPSFLSCHMSACPCQLSQLTSRKPPLTDKHKILGNTDSFHCRNSITLQIFLRKINDEKVLYTSI